MIRPPVGAVRPAGPGLRQHAALPLMLASGFSGLGYQVVWTQQSALWLGHESAAVLAVVAAFFGGLALGALLLGPPIERSLHPVRWYAGCELLIAGWSLALALVLPLASGALLDLTGAQPTPAWQWSVAFCGTFILLLPATAAMGATLPSMERAMAPLRLPGRSIAALYAGNTGGAVIGVLACAFWLVPALGLARTAGVCAVLNLLCAALAWWAFSAPCGATAAAAGPATDNAARQANPARRMALALLAATGLLGIGYEVVVVRVLSQVTEDTVYTFALLLAIYLVGSALGAAAYQRWRPRAPQPPGKAALGGGNLSDRFADQPADPRYDNPPDRLGSTLASTLAAACLLGAASLWAAERVKAIWLDHWGSSLGAALGAEALLAVLAFGLPTAVMGSLFGHLSTRASAAGASFGQSLGVNTLGAAAAPLLFGVLVTPALGPKWALLLIAAGYLALAGRQAWGRRTARTATCASAAAGLALAAWAPPLAFVELPEGGRLISYQEGAMAAVSVVQDAAGVSRLRINNRQQEGSSTSGRVDARQALLPVLLHPAPRRALFLGLGTGMTAAAAAADPTVQVDAVELLPEVVRASAHFTGASAGNPNRNPAGNPPEAQARVLVADARRFVRTSAQAYDVIVSDNFHPARSGSGSLYTVEHFQAVRGRLASGGLFCQWLPLHQMDLATLRSIVQSFLMAYPDGSALLASNSLLTPVLGLVGHSDGGHTTLTAVRQRLANAAGPMRPVDFGIEDEYALLGNFVAGPRALARFAGNAAANTDDRPVVAYIAPRITYAPDAAPGDRLVALLQQLSIDSTDLLTATPPDPAGRAAAHRLEAYWAARTQFIVAGLQVRPAASAQALLVQVRNPLLAVLRTSPDFRPAYDPLLRIATSLARSDPHAARAVLTDLAQIQPARPEAGLALRQLGIAMR